MILTAKSEYGLLAMIDLAASPPDVPVSSRVLAEGRGIPQPYLEQLIASLRKGGLVRAVRGARGGFVLARPADQISVLDIVETLEGQELSTGICDAETHEGCTASGSCVAAPVWSRAAKALRDLFTTMNLEELAQEQKDLDRAKSAHDTEETKTASGVTQKKEKV